MVVIFIHTGTVSQPWSSDLPPYRWQAAFGRTLPIWGGVWPLKQQQWLATSFWWITTGGTFVWTHHIIIIIHSNTVCMSLSKLPYLPDFSCRIADLQSQLPPEVLEDRYCVKLLLKLSGLQQFMRDIGPQVMSRQQLISVLGSLRPWELRSPEINAAVQVNPDWLFIHSQSFTNTWLL